MNHTNRTNYVWSLCYVLFAVLCCVMCCVMCRAVFCVVCCVVCCTHQGVGFLCALGVTALSGQLGLALRYTLEYPETLFWMVIYGVSGVTGEAFVMACSKPVVVFKPPPPHVAVVVVTPRRLRSSGT